MAFTVSDPQQLRDRVDQWPTIRARLEAARAAAGADPETLAANMSESTGIPVVDSLPVMLARFQDSTWDRVGGYLDGITRFRPGAGGWPGAADTVRPWPGVPDARPPTLEQLQALETDTDMSALVVARMQTKRAAWPWVGLWVTARRAAVHWGGTGHKNDRARAKAWAQHRDAIAWRAVDTWNSWELIWADQMQVWEDSTLPLIHAHERPLPSWH